MNETVGQMIAGDRKVCIFDRDAFFAEVAEKYDRLVSEGESIFKACVRDISSMRSLWDKVLSMPIQGDASLFPNQDGRVEPALMEVWHKAGDFWRAKYRLGDTLYCDQHGLVVYPYEIEQVQPQVQKTKAVSVQLDLFS